MQKKYEFSKNEADKKDTVELKLEKATIKTESRTAIRSIYDATMRRAGGVSREQYVWQKIGAVVLVLNEDVEHLLSLRLGGVSCCGGMGQDGNKIFELAN